MCLSCSHYSSISTYTKDKATEVDLQKYHVLKQGQGEGGG